jgi:hypothetical protein
MSFGHDEVVEDVEAIIDDCCRSPGVVGGMYQYTKRPTVRLEAIKRDARRRNSFLLLLM